VVKDVIGRLVDRASDRHIAFPRQLLHKPGHQEDQMRVQSLGRSGFSPCRGLGLSTSRKSWRNLSKSVDSLAFTRCLVGLGF
jgi:hypothetical protein